MTQQTITVQQIIDTLGLAPLPVEGGLYRETYRSEETHTASTSQNATRERSSRMEQRSSTC